MSSVALPTADQLRTVANFLNRQGYAKAAFCLIQEAAILDLQAKGDEIAIKKTMIELVQYGIMNCGPTSAPILEAILYRGWGYFDPPSDRVTLHATDAGVLWVKENNK